MSPNSVGQLCGSASPDISWATCGVPVWESAGSGAVRRMVVWVCSAGCQLASLGSPPHNLLPGGLLIIQ